MVPRSESSGAASESGPSSNATDRLRALRRYEVVDTPPEDEFDRLAELATAVADAPIGLVSFVEADRQWHKAAVGTPLDEIARPHSFCAHAIETAGPSVIEDLTRHERFAGNPYVDETAAPDYALRFYAGAPITTPGGHRLGTVCVLDVTSRTASDETIQQLRHLADLAMEALDPRAPDAPPNPDANSSGPEGPLPSGETPRSATERRYRTILKHAPVTVAELDTDLRYRWISNPHLEADAQAIRGQREDDLHAGPGVDRLMALEQQALEHGAQIREEVTFGQEAPPQTYDVTISPLREGDGETVTGLRLVALDITDQKRQERTLERQNDLFAKAQEIANVGAWEYNLRGEKQTLTSQTYAIHGLDPTEALPPEKSIEFYHPDDQPTIREAFKRAVEMGTPYDLELRLQDADGQERWVRTRGEPQTVEGEVVRVRGTIQDITERKEMEQALRQQKDLLGSVTENISDGIYRSTQETGIVYANQAFVDMFGYDSLEDLREAPPTSLYAKPGDREALYRREADGDVLDGVEVQFRRKDGTTFTGLISTSNLEEQDGETTYYDGAVTDITEQKQQERRLRQRQRKLEALYEATGQLLRAKDKDDVADLLITLISETLGYSGTTIRLAKDGRLEASRVAPMVQERMPERPAYDLEGDTPAAEAYRTGTTNAFADLSSEDPSLDRGDIRATAYVPMESHGLISVGSPEVNGIEAFDLRLIEVLGAYATVVLDRLDREKRLRRAKAQAEEARRDAEEANRMKSTFLANMSHEIRTPLTSIIGFAEAIGEAPSDEEGGLVSNFAELIENSGQRLLATLDSVLNLSKLEAGQMDLERQPVDLVAEAEAIVDELRPEAAEKEITLQVDTPPPSVRAIADAGGVQIIARNLVSNAIKYTEDGGSIWVRLYGDEDTETPGELAPSPHAVLEVEDTGMGMDPEHTEGLFEPFRQASEGKAREYEGTGIGLAVTKAVVDQMNGTIQVDTEKGVGSRFTVRLPMVTEASERTAKGHDQGH